MADDDTPPAERGSRRMELLAATILGLAGVLTAFSAYKAALTDGDALKGYTRSAALTADANGLNGVALQTFTSDQALFLEYQLLIERNETATAFAIRDRLFSPELEAGTVAWEAIPAGAVDEPPTPLDTEEYSIPERVEAQERTDRAAAEYAAAQEVDDAGDRFELASVFLAVSLFLAGVATLFHVHSVQVAVLAMSIVALVPGAVAIVQGQSAL